MRFHPQRQRRRKKVRALPKPAKVRFKRGRGYSLDELIEYCAGRRGRRYAFILSYLEEVKAIHVLTFHATKHRLGMG